MEAKRIRAYIRSGITQIPMRVQRKACQRVADEMGLKVEWYAGSTLKDIADERELWARQLHDNEIGLVYSLRVLRLTGKQLKHEKPKAEFSGFMYELGGRALYLMEACKGGITSKQAKAWRELITEVTEGRPPGTNGMTSEKASWTAKEGWKTRYRGTVAYFRSDDCETERANLIEHRKACKSDGEAHRRLAEFAARMGGKPYDELVDISVTSMRRILEPKLK